jgi:fucose 4-O-acetylase-like acetyltransferase
MFKESSMAIPQSLASAERYSWVDYARGIAIILVVYRHVVVGLMRADVELSPVAFNLQEVFYNFRMPLFFVLSGVFVFKSQQSKSFSRILRDRSSTILYPYLLWGAILITLQIIFSRFANSERSFYDYQYLITQPRKIDHLWYLFALFNTSLLYLLLDQVIKWKAMHLVIGAILHALTLSPFLEHISLISDLCYFYLYFVCGVTFSRVLLDKELQTKIFSLRIALPLLLIFVSGQWFWYTRQDEEASYLPLFFVITLIGCLIVYMLALYLARFNSTRWLSYIGEHSLYIYILHVPIAAMVRALMLRTGADMPGALMIGVCWICGIALPVIIYQALKDYGFKKMFSLK